MSEPWTLFRYRGVNEWLTRELSDSSIFHNAPADFNDPFDCRVDTEKAFGRALKKPMPSARRALLEVVQRKFQSKPPSSFDLGVCCFSSNVENPLMWSHYADSHRGVCLLYKFPANYFLERYPPSESDGYFVGCERVHYGDDAYTDWLVSGDFPASEDELTEVAATRTLIAKAQCWAHEEEFRTVVSRSKWAMHFEPAFLAQVIFGLKTSDAHKSEISALALKSNPDVHFANAVASDERDFAVTFTDA